MNKLNNNLLVSTFIALTLSVFLSTGVRANPVEKAATYDMQTEQYAMVNATGKLLSLTKWKVAVDFGQELEIGIKNKDLMRTEEGEVINFNSPIDALNYLNGQGWTLVSSSSDGERFTAVMKRTMTQ